MDQALLQDLRGRRHAIAREWAALLRAEPVATPVGHPDALVRLIGPTLDEILRELAREDVKAGERVAVSFDAVRRECACDRSPLLAFFLAGERAVLEGLILAQAARKPGAGGSPPTELTEAYLVLRRMARREVKVFCSVCQHRTKAAQGAPERHCNGQAAAELAACATPA